MRTPRKAKSDADWLDTLPEAFTDYLDGRRLEEVECIIPDLAGTSRGKAMPSYKFRPDETFYLPISLFYQTISGEYVDMEIENQWLEKDVVLTPDMSTATAVPWADDATAQIICDLANRDGSPLAIAPRNVTSGACPRAMAKRKRSRSVCGTESCAARS